MKSLHFFIIGLALVFFGCTKETHNPEDDTNENTITSLSGQLSRFEKGEGYVTKFSNASDTNESWGSSTIDANGNFNISTLETPESNLLGSIELIGDILQLNVTNLKVSNSSAKFVIAGLRVFDPGNKFYCNIVRARLGGNLTTVGDFNTYCYIYSSQDAFINGTTSSSSLTLTFNLSLGKGWNKFILKYAGPGMLEVTSKEPEGGIWYLN